MNKAKLYFDLQQWVEIGMGVPDMIVDSPFQHKDYAPYVVAQYVRKTPRPQIPVRVLEMLREELIADGVSLKPNILRRWFK